MLATVVDAKNQLGECVLWCERSERVLWTDILGSTLHARYPASGKTQKWAMPEPLASFALTANDDRRGWCATRPTAQSTGSSNRPRFSRAA